MDKTEHSTAKRKISNSDRRNEWVRLRDCSCVALAEAGATVILASRNQEKGQSTMEKICAQAPGVKLIFEEVDLANLGSVAQFCTRINVMNQAVDILVNNAGVHYSDDRRRV